MTQKTETYSGDIPRTPFGFVMYTMRPFWVLATFGFLVSVLTQLIAAFIPLYIGRFVDDITQTQEVARFGWWSLVFILINVLFYASYRVAGFTAIRLVLKQNKYAFKEIKRHLLQHSHTYFINTFAGSVTSRIFHAGDRSSELILMQYYGLVRLVVSVTAGAILIGLISLELLAVYVCLISFSIALNAYLVKRRRPFVVDYASATSKYCGQITDVASNISAVRQYAHIDREYQYLNNELHERTEKDRVQWAMAEWNHVINNILAVVLLASIVGGMFWLTQQGRASVGEMVVVMILLYRLSGILVDIGDWMNRLMRVYGEIEEGLSSILTDHEILDHPFATTLTTTSGHIQFTDTTFSYDSEVIFSNLNLNIKPGQRIGLVGPSGAGKSTLVSLLLRQHDIDSGAITIDNQNIAEVTQDSLRSNIALVPQEPLLFHRTIRENIMYGKPEATFDEMIQAAERAQARDFIEALPDQYDTLVGERGVKLSGGQKQRVAIARAMLKEAPILVLDEATSALDSESEVAIQKALEELMEGKTVIAVAHRLSTLRKMDRILVIDKGQIVEDGTHDTLTQAGGLYAKLWEHQAGGFLRG